MEDLKINLKENEKTLKIQKTKSRKKHWTLILVGEYGEMFYVRKLKTLVTLNVLIILILCISLALLVFLDKNEINKNREVKKELNALMDKAAALQDEKDMLMVRLVIAESALKKENESASVGGKKSSNKIIDESLQKKLENKKDIKRKQKESKKKVKEKEKTASSQPEVSTGVDIKDFSFLYDSHNDIIKTKLKLINTSINNKPVSGHAFVVLKSDNVTRDKWLVSPLVQLKDGRPLNIKKGRYFSISRYTFLWFEEKITIDPSKFDKVSVYIFSLKEKLLLQKVFPVKINPKPEINIPAVNNPALSIKGTEEKKLNKNIIEKQAEIDVQVNQE